ncbi:MAG: asparaginase domain-containing protein [Ruminococcus sp.]|nr:asparaginase domain-containing protein [Ruminococcus sp.]
MKALMIFTGGTIASIISDNAILPIDNGGGSKSRLVDMFFGLYPKYHEKIEFECEFLLNKLSENMKLSDWEKIVSRLLSVDDKNYDAIFIAHGSDTLAYFANMLSVFFGNKNLPVFVIASDRVLEDKRANGLENLKCGVDALLNGVTSGVYVPYKNEGEAVRLHKGYQITQSQILGSSFYSLPSRPLYCDEFSGFKKRVLILKSYVGADYSLVDTKCFDSILIELYHGGTTDVDVLKVLVEKARTSGTEIYAASVKSENTLYESTVELQRLGVKFLHDLTLETAYACLLSGVETD